MKVRTEHVICARSVAELALQFAAEHAKSGTAVKDKDLVSDAHFDAGGVASGAQVLGLWSGRGTAHPPKLNSHKLLPRRRSMAASAQTHSEYRGCCDFNGRWVTELVTKVWRVWWS